MSMGPVGLGAPGHVEDISSVGGTESAKASSPINAPKVRNTKPSSMAGQFEEVRFERDLDRFPMHEVRTL
ncbi:MAG: hypothetical protein LBR92_00325 [Puniceicoccales bacterium]|jgi:hypothetical protein|nr:hypothetical protein [Puniceicoccales bacterium]